MAGRLRRILHATDFSRASGRAFAHAVALARRNDARLLVLHVVTPPSPFADAEPASSWLELEARATAWARRQLARLVSRATKAGARSRGLLVRGTPADVIVGQARRERVDVIVIGTHGRSGLGRLFMGSVASRVLHQAPCPVITVRGAATAGRRPAR